MKKTCNHPEAFILEGERIIGKAAELTDGELETCTALMFQKGTYHYWGVLRPDEETTYSIELRWKDEIRISALVIYYAVFKGKACQPHAGHAHIHYHTERGWKRIPARPIIDCSQQGCYASYRQLGFTKWVYNFPPVITNKIRYTLEKPAANPANNELFKQYVVRGIKCCDTCVDIKPVPLKHIKFRGRKGLPGISKARVDRIARSKIDLLGTEIIENYEEPDYESVARCLLPMDFTKAAIGREYNEVETLVTWNGTLIMVENGGKTDWDHGSARSYRLGKGATIVMRGVENWVDRWFAFAVGQQGELFGSNLGRIHRSYINGYQPGIETTYRAGGLLYKMRVFVTHPESKLYANIVEVAIRNCSKSKVESAFQVVMGRHKSEATHECVNLQKDTRCPIISPACQFHPLYDAPLATGYYPDSDRKTVWGRTGIVLRSDRAGALAGTAKEPVFRIPLQLKPGQTNQFNLQIPVVTTRVSSKAAFRRPEKHARSFDAHWSSVLTEHTVVATPEQRVNDFQKNVIAQILISLLNGKKLKYGAYWYEEYYGLEEAVAITALAKYGYFAEAKSAVEVALSPALLDEGGYHHQYRRGGTASLAAKVFALTRDTPWLERLMPPLVMIAEWILRARSTEQGEYQGLLPKTTYGGDIRTPARSLATNAICWKGLYDIAGLMKACGRDDLSSKYWEAAGNYRQAIVALVNKVTNRTIRPMFIPMAVDIGKSGEKGYQKAEKPYSSLSQVLMGFYWQAFANWFLETQIYSYASEEVEGIIRYMEQKGGLLLGQTRLGKYAGNGDDIDPHYGIGYQEALLARGERKKFLLAFYGLLAHGMSRDTFAAPEASNIFPQRSDPEEWNRMFERTRWGWGVITEEAHLTEPLAAGAPAVALYLLRDMLVREEENDNRGVLHLLSGIPGKWIQPGKSLTLTRAPTAFGAVDLSLKATGAHVLEIKMKRELCRNPDQLRLHLPIYEKQKIISVKVNGNDWLHHQQAVIALPPSVAALDVQVAVGPKKG